MKIAILGSRGIPNAYGGFEQFAEYVSAGLVERGHDVYVYNSSTHPYQSSTWNGVNIIHCYDPENKLGTAGQFVYDFNCILDSRKRNFDVILQLGYTSSSIWGNLLPSKSAIVTNMDGLEWKRSKYSPKVQSFLRWAENKAIETSDVLVADSIGIKKYLSETYKATSTYIPYGAHPFTNPNDTVLSEYNLQANEYGMLIARLEPENNIETILQGLTESQYEGSFLVIGKHDTPYGRYIKNLFQSDQRIQFLGGIYDMNKLNNLRYFSNLYFHGHSVGGTNPSLLEAMSSQALICAHHNPFNEAILKKDAYYFSNAQDVTTVFENANRRIDQYKVENNLEKIKNIYEWSMIIDQYEHCLLSAVNEKTGKLIPVPSTVLVD